MITINQLKGVCPNRAVSRLTEFIDPLNKYFARYEINSILRVQHFLAQACHETGEFKYLKELASGEAYDIGKLATRLGNTPEDDGDGEKYKGRGIFQTTGTANYKLVSEHLFGDDRLLNNPDLLCEIPNAVQSACYYWVSHNLNMFADKDDILSITKRINGGTNGLDSRKYYLDLAKKNIK